MAVNEWGDQIVAPRSLGRNEWGDPIVGSSGRTATPKEVQDVGDAIIAGLQASSMGLLVRGKLPSQVMGEDAPWYRRLAYNVAGVGGDLIPGVAGFMGGSVAGAPAGPAGAVVGAGAGSFGLPMAMREGLTAAYNTDQALSWAGVMEIAKAAAIGGAKGAVIGGATLGAGRVVGGALAPAATATGAVARGTAVVGTELATMMAASAVVEQHMPTAQDFLDNAILLGGMKAAGGIAKNMRSTWAETGRRPEQQLADAQADPAIKAALERVRAIPDEATILKPDEALSPAYRPLAVEERIKAALDTDPRPEFLRANLMGEQGPTKWGDPLADPVKYEYIADRDTLKGVERAVVASYKAEIDAQTRGVRTNKETAAESIRMLLGGEVAERIIGQAENAETIAARGHLLKGALNEAKVLMDALARLAPGEVTPNSKLAALAALERVSMLYAEFSGAAAEAGRALQIFRAMKRDPSFLNEGQTLLKLAERRDGGRTVQDVAKLIAEFKDPAQLATFSKWYSKASGWEKIIEGWKAGILSGPQTHLANIMGNLGKWAVEIPESAVAATFEAVRRGAAGDPLTMAQFKARALAPFYGLQYGARDSLTVAAQVWKNGDIAVEKGDHYRNAIEGKKGDVIRLPFRALQVEDALFRTVAERGQAYIMAVDRVAREGLDMSTREGREAITRYVEDPAFGLSDKAGLEALAKIQEAGAEAVFAQRLGPRMESLQRAMAGSPMQFVMPFVRTPVNILSWVSQHTPILNMMSGRWRADWQAGGERQSRAVARLVIGFGLGVTAYSLAQDGLLTGGGQFEKEQGGTKRAAGWQPYSVKVGDKYYSYQRLEPVGKLVGLAADLLELTKSTKDDNDAFKTVTMLALMLGNATVSTTYLSGLSNLINATTDPDRYAEAFMEQYASSVVPKIVGQTTTMFDDEKREVDGILEAVQSQLPFVREKLMAKRDVWGEPAQNDRWFSVLPIATSEASQDKVRTEAVRLQLAIADVPKFVSERGPFKPSEKRIELTAEQRDVFRAVSGKNAMSILAPIVNAPDWPRIPDFAKAEIYKKVIEGTRKQGQWAALPPDETSRVNLRQSIVDRIIKETTASEGK